MAATDPEPEKKPRRSRREQSGDTTAVRLPPTAVRAHPEGPTVTIDHVSKATAKHVASLSRERRQLLADIAFLRDEISQRESKADRLQADLDQLRPELARTKADLRNTKDNASIALVVNTLGAIAVAASGFVPDFLRMPIAFAGIAMMLSGLLFQFTEARRRSP